MSLETFIALMPTASRHSRRVVRLLRGRDARMAEGNLRRGR